MIEEYSIKQLRNNQDLIEYKNSSDYDGCLVKVGDSVRIREPLKFEIRSKKGGKKK